MNLELLSRKRRYWQEDEPDWVRKIWSRPQAFDYFIKYNRSTLVDQAALIKIGRDYFVNSDKFPEVATEILGLSNDTREEITHAS
jgi:hypothetical protein